MKREIEMFIELITKLIFIGLLAVWMWIAGNQIDDLEARMDKIEAVINNQ